MQISLNNLVVNGWLTTALVLAFLSALMAAGSFAYLHRRTKNVHFQFGLMAWLYYALTFFASMELSIWPENTALVIVRQSCVGLCGLGLLWQALAVIEKTSSGRERGFGVVVMVLANTFAIGFFHARPAVLLPPYLLVTLAGLFSAAMYLRRYHAFGGARLHAAALALWSVQVTLLPVLEQRWPGLVSVNYVTAAVLMLALALTALVAALEEGHEQTEKLRSGFWEGVASSRILKQEYALSEQKYHALFHSTGDAIFIVDLETLKVLEANEAAMHFLGGGAPGGSFVEVCPQLGRPSLSLLENKRLFDALMRDSQEFLMRRPNGQSVPCEGSVNLVHYNQRPVLQVRIREITERKRLEQQLRQTEKLSALGRLVAGVAHELNNPLAVIVGYAQLLAKNGTAENKVRNEAQKIIHESERAAKIVRNLLTFAQPREPQLRAVDLNQIIADVVETQSGSLSEGGIVIYQHLTPSLPQTVADADQIEQVLTNLLVNAIQALDNYNGPRQIDVATEKRDQWLRITIADTGPGVSQEIVTKVFDPFFTTKAPGKGTGLGLSICYSVIEEHGGRIWVESERGKGARFMIELPLQSTAVIASPLPPPPKPKIIEPVPDAAQRRLLVVDDEPGIVEVLKAVLEASGYTVETACNGVEALKQIETNQYDVIISDLCMPGMDGEALYKKVKALKPELAKRIIFVTGDTVSEQSRSFIDGTGNRWLGKPFNLVEIEAVVSTILHNTPLEFSKN